MSETFTITNGGVLILTNDQIEDCRGYASVEILHRHRKEFEEEFDKTKATGGLQTSNLGEKRRRWPKVNELRRWRPEGGVCEGSG